MLKDEVRTVAYKNAIYRNRHLFAGKVVLDIGCGTGILSMFAATAGAKLVIGVDMSGIIEQAKVIVAANNLQDKVVLLRGKMEEVQLPVPQVDIIISEWMGYFLLYESMLDTVLYARDRYLAPGGVILPDRARMHITAIEDAQYKEEKIHFWDNVYGFDMSSIKSWALREPLVDVVEAKAVVGSECCFREIDIMTVTKEQLSFTAPFSIRMQRSDWVHALLAYFSIDFSARLPDMKAVHFGTGPHDRYTHWKQTVFYLPQDLSAEQGDTLTGTLMCKPNGKNPRDLDVSITCELHEGGAEGALRAPAISFEYHMC